MQVYVLKPGGGKQKKEMGKKVTREKRLKTTRFVLISRNHTPAAAERDL